jgi:hypothetical protein
LKIKNESWSLFAVVADRFDRATLKGFIAESDVFFGLGLLVDEGVTTFIVTGEEGRRGLATQIAVDALLIDVELSTGVLLPLVFFISHDLRKKDE